MVKEVLFKAFSEKKIIRWGRTDGRVEILLIAASDAGESSS